MAWNHRSRVVAMAFAIQSAAGAFTQPNQTTDLIAVSSPTNTIDPITADDPTATGTVWESNRVYLGKTATIGGTVPLRGPGGAAPPAANAFVPGRVLQSGGWAEIRKATANTAAVVSGTTTSINLATTESSVDDFLIGAPLQHANIGTGFRATTLVSDYIGTSRQAVLAETLGSAPAAASNYTIPAFLSYQLGTLVSSTPYLSVSIWRDKKRYDYRDFTPSSIALTIPVANEANTSFPDMTFSGKGYVQAVADQVSPALSAATLAVPIPPARDGKFYLDRTKLGHQQMTFTVNTTVAGASNQNQAAGQDAYDLVSGNRTLALDLNQMAVSDYDLHGQEDAQNSISTFATWGLGAGNRWGFIVPNVVLDPFSPGDRNGYVNVTGNAYSTDVDKSATLTIWW